MKDYKFKKYLMILFAVMLCMFSAVTAFAASPKLNKTKATVKVGETCQLKVTGTKSTVKWSSGNKSVATVSSKGVVKGVKAGSANISAKVNGKTLKCKVTVKSVAVKSVSLSKSKVTMNAGGSYTLKATVKPTNATNKNVTWKSSDKKVATVSSKGVVKAVSAGKATITVTTKDGKKKATCTVTVKSTGIEKLSIQNAVVESGKTVQMKLVKEPADVSCGFTWKSSDTSIAAVDKNGVVTGKKEGKATITATADDESKASVSATVQVKLSVKGISASYTGEDAEIGTAPDVSDFKVYQVMSDGSKKATDAYSIQVSVDGNNYVAKISDGTYSTTVKVPIKTYVKGYTITMNPATVKTGEGFTSGQIKVTAAYSDGTTKNITDFTTDFTAKNTEGSYSFKIYVDGKAIAERSVTVTAAASDASLKKINAVCKKSSVFTDEALSSGDFTVTGTYSDGTTKAITDFTLMYSKTSTHGGNAKAVISYNEMSVTLQVPAYVRTYLKDISVSGFPAEVLVGENLDLSKVVVSGTQYDGTAVKPTDYTVDYSPKTTAGNYKVNLSCRGQKVQFTVAVKEKSTSGTGSASQNGNTSSGESAETKSVTSIQASCSLSEVTEASEVTKDSIIVYDVYSDGSKQKCSSYSVSGSYNQSSGCYVFTVTKTGTDMKTTFSVKKKAETPAQTATVTGIEVTCSKTLVKEGEQITTSDLSVKDVYSDGTKKNISVSWKASIELSGGYYVVTVTSDHGNATVKVKAEEKAAAAEEVYVKSYSFSLNPAQVYTGEGLASGQLKITAVYSDGTEKQVTDFTTDFTPKSTAGTYSFNVYDTSGKTISTKEIKVVEKTPAVTLKSVSASANKSSVFVGDTMSPSDFTMTGTYSDGSQKTITDFSVSFTSASHGQKGTAILSYEGYSLTINVPVYERTYLKDIKVVANRALKTGEGLSGDAITVTGTQYDGSSVTATDWTTDFTAKDTPGTYTASISCRGMQVSVDITVQ